MQRTRHTRAFTLAELMVGLMVTSIILSAVATLAFALSSATRASDDVIYTQTQVRAITPRILDLVRYSRMICAHFDNTLVIWRADGNSNDRIDVNEVVYLEYNGLEQTLKLWEFVLDSDDNTDVLAALGLPAEPGVLAELAMAQTKTALIEGYSAANPSCVREIAILRECSGVSFVLAPDPPRTRRVTVSFTLDENGIERHYEIDVVKGTSADHLLRGDPPKLVSDDD